MSINMKEVEKRISELEHRCGKWVISYTLHADGTIGSIEFADIGPFDDYVIVVQGMRPELCRQEGKLQFTSVDDRIPDEIRDLYLDWLLSNIEAQGGYVNRSGVYRWVLGMPKPVADALGIVPEMVIWDEDDDDDNI